MKTLLLLLALSIPCATADETSYTRTAFECMKQKKCTVGVNKLTPDSYDGEARDIIKNLDRIGVSVHIAAPRYFIDEYRGVYFPDKNSINVILIGVKNFYPLFKYCDMKGGMLHKIAWQVLYTIQTCKLF